MLENTDKEDKKAASTTTSPTPTKSKVKENIIPKRSQVKGQKEIKTPKKSEVSSQDDQRSTTWTFLVYPDSAPNDWIDILKGLHVPFILSPLHDKDIKDKTTG